jgi:hypothetical protein
MTGVGWLIRTDKGTMPSVSFKYFYFKGDDNENQAVFGHGITVCTM